MIFITGDTHGERARIDRIQREAHVSKGDYLIICGDFGYIFRNNEDEMRFLDSLEEKDFTICFLDGNHENFPAIDSYPLESWNGGQIHRVRKNILHLMRGEIYTIEGHSFFVMGGAYSIDRPLRTLNVSYWDEELPNSSEYKNASENLKRHGMKVDYILTHTAPSFITRYFRNRFNTLGGELESFLEWIACEVEFREWFFGHWHFDKKLDGKYRALWFDVIQIPEVDLDTVGESHEL